MIDLKNQTMKFLFSTTSGDEHIKNIVNLLGGWMRREFKRKYEINKLCLRISYVNYWELKSINDILSPQANS